MNEIVRTAWAAVKANHDFICVQTFSGYRSCRADPEGGQYLLSVDVSDVSLGEAVQSALAASRFVLAERREGVWIHPEATFDRRLYDPMLTEQRYVEWTKRLMSKFDYKSKRELFKGMKNCSIKSTAGVLTISPTIRERMEGWAGMPDDEDVVAPTGSSPLEVGSAVRLALSRCR